MDIEAKLAEMGLMLPAAPPPVATYVPWTKQGKLLYISGQISQGPQGPIRGKLGADLNLEAGEVAARACALSLLAQAKAALGGDFGKLKRLVKLIGFVNSTPDFADHPKVINGASDLFVETMGEAGKHVRSSVGVASLPMGVAVEIEALFETK
jgi:enamine deaminase RidA (YjgF/YER057c/UK114 family)